MNLIQHTQTIQEYKTKPRPPQKQFAKLIGHGRPLAGRSIEDCQQCYDHLARSRIAYFGPPLTPRSAGTVSPRFAGGATPRYAVGISPRGVSPRLHAAASPRPDADGSTPARGGSPR